MNKADEDNGKERNEEGIPENKDAEQWEILGRKKVTPEEETD